MKLLLDSCVPGGLKTQFLNAGYDVVWTGDWNEDPGDEEILATAFREGRILITLLLLYVSRTLQNLFFKIHGHFIRILLANSNFECHDVANQQLRTLFTDISQYSNRA
ncbi:DUF5615 family PIN-like protein [Calothrix sp. CCY 0018]|uniref:DUF5615 family PIN-like protein n=1 Tax=Calothrix sp. CCY 0018 TaxID=3103864 RepID=UPI0039C66886